MVKRSLLGSLVLTILFWVGAANWAVFAYLRTGFERRRVGRILSDLDEKIKVDNFVDSFGKAGLELEKRMGVTEHPCGACDRPVTYFPGPSIVVMFSNIANLEWFCNTDCLQQYLTVKILLEGEKG